MTVPDGLVYATIPTLGIVFLWMARAFVRQEKGDTGSQGATGAKGDTGSMTVRDYQQMSTLMQQVFNGRYMNAQEARDNADETRERFEKLEHKLDAHAAEVTAFIERVKPLLPVPVTRP
jgi:hypothetical protein